MAKEKKLARLGQAMEVLGVPAVALGPLCGFSASLVSAWQHGRRPLTARSKAVKPLAAALLKLEKGGELDAVLAPYQMDGESRKDALCAFLLGQELPDLPARTEAPAAAHSGEYVARHRVLLGHKGFCRAALLMLDYLLVLPPGREVVVLCQGQYGWLTRNLVFVLQFIAKLQKVVRRGTRLTVINRRGYSIAETAAFAGPWLAAHMKGYIRSLYYDGELPPGERFIASIKGYWCGYAMEDDTAEDSLYITLHTDPRALRRGEALCETYRERAKPASQYAFLQRPAGDEENPRLWKRGPLPAWDEPDAPAPTGCFYAISRTPCFGVITREEWIATLGGDTPPALPEYLFSKDGAFAPGPHKIVLCREDVRDALAKRRAQSLPLCALLGRRAFVSREVLAAQLKRLLAALGSRDDFEVALVPRAAFAKLQLELTCWENSAAVGWLQNGEQSVFAGDRATSGSFYGFLDHAWGKLHKGWRRKRDVRRQLLAWLKGNELDAPDADSQFIRAWDVLPKG